MTEKIQDIITTLEDTFPLSLQEEWDNSGLQLGITSQACRGILLTLDVTEAVIWEAIETSCNLIIAHHPLLFRGVKRIGNKSYIEKCIHLAIKHDIVIYATHTNVDVSPKGLNIFLAEELRWQDIQILQCHQDKNIGLGAIGNLPYPMTIAEYLENIKHFFATKQIRHNIIDLDKQISRVAICGGSGAYLWEDARCQGAELFITGEAKYNDYLDAEGIGFVTIGHYESEILVTNLFARIIKERHSQTTICITNVGHNPVKIL